MNHHKGKDGLQIGNTVSVSLQGQKEDRIEFVVSEVIILCIGIISSIVCFASSFNLLVYNSYLYIVLAISIIIFDIMFTYSKCLKYAFPLWLLLNLLILKQLWSFVCNGFYYIENAVIDKLNAYYKLGLFHYVAEKNEALCTSIFLFFIGEVLLFIFLVVIKYRIFKELYYVLSLLLGFGGFFVGVIPNWISLIGVILVAFMIITMETVPFSKGKQYDGEGIDKQKIRRKYKQKIRLRCAWVLSLMIGIILLFSSILVSKHRYDDVNVLLLHPAKEKIQGDTYLLSEEDYFYTFFNRLNELDFGKFNLFKSNTSGGGLAGGKLSSAETVTFRNETALSVIVPVTPNNIYLKGYVGCTYEGDSWKGLSSVQENQYEQLVGAYGASAYDGLNLSNGFFDLVKEKKISFRSNNTSNYDVGYQPLFSEYKMQIRYDNANSSFFYLPYYSTAEDFDKIDQSDLYSVPKQKVQEYSISYMQPSISTSLDTIPRDISLDTFFYSFAVEQEGNQFLNLLQFEKEYSDYVNQVYLQMSKSELQRLENLNFQIPYATDEESTVAVIKQIISYLSEETTYSLSPGKLPVGEDFVSYFLFTSKKGYCAHYASAATLLLRKYGVPARYVEGYVITANDMLEGEQLGNCQSSTYLFNGDQIQEETPTVKVDIKDSNAHAWVEVYFHGYGWVPIEVTVGYYDESFLEEDESETKETVLNSETPTPTISLAPTQAEEVEDKISPTKEPMITQIEEEKATFANEKNIKGVLGGRSYKVQEIIFAVVVGIIMAMSIIAMRGQIIFKLRKKKLMDSDTRMRMLLLYEQMERIFMYMSINEERHLTRDQFAKKVMDENPLLPKELDEIIALVLKAKYSEDDIEYDEYQKVMSYYVLLRRRLYTKRTFFFKIYAKYIKVL